MISVMSRFCIEDPTLIIGWKDHLLLFSPEKSVPASPLQTFPFQIESYWRSKEEIEKRIVRRERSCRDGCKRFQPEVTGDESSPDQIFILYSASSI